MTYYSKVIAAVVGLLVLFAARYGLDLESQQQLIIDALVAIATAVSVYLAKNKPTTPEQLKEAKEKLPTVKEVKEP